MAVFTVKVPEGELSKAIRQISAWDGKTRLRVEAALKRGTNAVYREARQRVPIRSGKLKKSIRQRFSTVKLEGQVFSNQPYAHLVEFGSRAHTVKPRKKGSPVFPGRACLYETGQDPGSIRKTLLQAGLRLRGTSADPGSEESDP